MNPLKSHNIVAKILQVYAYVNAAAGMILTLSLVALVEDWGAVVAVIFFASSLVVNFLIFALGEIIDLLQTIKENTNGTQAVMDELPDL